MGMQTLITSAAGIATVCALIVIVIELYKNLRFSKTQFEDHIFSQYLELSYSMPYKAMVGGGVAVSTAHNEAIFNFFMLSEHCIRLYKQGRIRKSAWVELHSMIRLNVVQPAFRKVWAECFKLQPERFLWLSKMDYMQKINQEEASNR